MNIKTSFDKAVRRAGIRNFRFHDLRHTFASYLVMAGVNIKTVQELLGHRSLEMTMRYAHLSPSYKRDAVRDLEKGIQERLQEKVSEKVISMDTLWTPRAI